MQQAVYLEPIGAPAIARAGLGHTHHQALPQATCLAGGTILLVDHADATVLAFGNATQIVVGAPEEGLYNRKRNGGALYGWSVVIDLRFRFIRDQVYRETRVEIF